MPKPSQMVIEKIVILATCIACKHPMSGLSVAALESARADHRELCRVA